MINDNTILSSFNDRPTLLEWLKKVEEALKSDTATGVSVENPSVNSYIFKITFADGKTIASDTIQFPDSVNGVSISNNHLIITTQGGIREDLGVINPYADSIILNSQTNTTEIGNNVEIGGNLKVNGARLDADGNPRFKYVPLELGTWFTDANVRNGFAFYAINGLSFRIVAGGIIPSGTTLPTSGKNFFREFNIPKWLADKIFFMDGSQWGDSKDIVPVIVPKASRTSNDGIAHTEQIDIGGYLGLKGRYRSSDNSYLITSTIGGISLTTTFDSYFRFEWNLIIN